MKDTLETAVFKTIYDAAKRNKEIYENAWEIRCETEKLLSGCRVYAGDGIGDNYTRNLVEKWVVFSGIASSGSEADFCARAALDGFKNHAIRIVDPATAKELISRIKTGNAVDEKRESAELRKAGRIE